MEDTGTDVIEIPLVALRFGREHILPDDILIEIETDPDDKRCFKGRIRIGGNLGKKISHGRKVRARRKG